LTAKNEHPDRQNWTVQTPKLNSLNTDPEKVQMVFHKLLVSTSGLQFLFSDKEDPNLQYYERRKNLSDLRKIRV